MPTSKFSGLKSAAYAPAGTTTWVDLGMVAPDGNFNPEPKGVDTAKGTSLYAGVDQAPELKIFDLTKYDALETIMKNDTEIDLQFTYLDASTDTVATYCTAKVNKSYSMKPGERNYFTLKLKGFKV